MDNELLKETAVWFLHKVVRVRPHDENDHNSFCKLLPQTTQHKLHGPANMEYILMGLVIS